jgi:hypothetical protein
MSAITKNDLLKQAEDSITSLRALKSELTRISTELVSLHHAIALYGQEDKPRLENVTPIV